MNFKLTIEIFLTSLICFCICTAWVGVLVIAIGKVTIDNWFTARALYIKKMSALGQQVDHEYEATQHFN